MKSLSLIFLILLVVIGLSCNQKLISGKYIYETGNDYFEINKNETYYYYSRKHSSWKFSQGKILYAGNVLNFIPDSSFFFRINVSKYYFDPTIDGRKIIIEGADSLLNRFHLSFNNGSSISVIYFKNNSVVYKPALSSYQDGSITIKAMLNDSITIIPAPVHNIIVSNPIFFSDVNNDDPNNKPWNVLVLKVNINGKMFAFTSLPPYILKNKSLMEKSFPVYKFTK